MTKFEPYAIDDTTQFESVVITKLMPEAGVTRSLFADTEALERESRLSSAMDAICSTYGRGAVRLGI